MMSRVLAAVAVAGLAAGAAPGAAALLSPSATAVPRGSTVLVIGTGFAPPNEFCRRPVVRVDGRPATVNGRIADDAGGWAVRIVATQAPGRHVALMRQECESGSDGSTRVISARATFRIFR
ncbi:MAG: hypothetical protein AB1416_07040 [Actinomycetota bacterium]